MDIILATTSKVRKEGFSQLRIPFRCEESNVDEYSGTRPQDPDELTLFLAEKKAMAIAPKNPESVIIGFDSVAYFKNIILEKPKNKEEAFTRLKMFSGKSHEHITGIYIINMKTGNILTKNIRTKIQFRKITNEEINKFMSQSDMYTNASLGYSPNLFYSASFIERIEGSMTDLMYAIPLSSIVPMLNEMGYKDA
jgi:septum formation protein